MISPKCLTKNPSKIASMQLMGVLANLVESLSSCLIPCTVIGWGPFMEIRRQGIGDEPLAICWKCCHQVFGMVRGRSEGSAFRLVTRERPGTRVASGAVDQKSWTMDDQIAQHGAGNEPFRLRIPFDVQSLTLTRKEFLKERPHLPRIRLCNVCCAREG